MGICSSGNNYKYEEKGKNEKHKHMLIYSSPEMRDNKNDFFCNCCSKDFKGVGSFYCVSCNYNMCKECFDYSGGIIINLYKDGQKGQVQSHNEHVLIYGKTNNKGQPGLSLGGKSLYGCKMCGATFLADYVKCWSCPKCEYDVCDKCFNENGGTIYSLV